MRKIAILAVCGLFLAAMLHGDHHKADEEGVRAAILDYVEGIYEVDPSRIERSVHSSLRKHGFYYQKGTWHETPMTYQQLYDLAATWNKDGKRANADSPKEITIFEVEDQTASAKLVAAWGQDYFHLAKYDGKWMITNVIWQSLPDKQ